jgi:hypothetical protein
MPTAVVLVIASLYFGKDVLIPLALAFALFGALGWLVAGQLFSLAKKFGESLLFLGLAGGPIAAVL